MRLWIVAIVFVMLTGCKLNFPKPEALSTVPEVKEVEAEGTENHHWTVSHMLKGQQLFVECIVENVSFSTEGRQGKVMGRAAVYIDGAFYKSYDTAAFIVKGLASGKHTIDVKLVGERNQPLGYEKTFHVTIP
ncbi:hypothetical protein [Bacillus sp. FJAT-42315]|uniref:hypothetical protein n=1 Tax=Bacillus sp. FJAT-42315 TaxID=2014077 RepID=UPI000C24C998|nr:hypothetical protein [Bacillus sp. FJAT-42315]